MVKIYFIVMLSALVLGAYFYGFNIADANCKTKYLQNNLQKSEQIQIKQRGFHDKVYKTGVADIRRILRDKYTIAE